MPEAPVRESPPSASLSVTRQSEPARFFAIGQARAIARNRTDARIVAAAQDPPFRAVGHAGTERRANAMGRASVVGTYAGLSYGSRAAFGGERREPPRTDRATRKIRHWHGHNPPIAEGPAALRPMLVTDPARRGRPHGPIPLRRQSVLRLGERLRACWGPDAHAHAGPHGTPHRRSASAHQRTTRTAVERRMPGAAYPARVLARERPTNSCCLRHSSDRTRPPAVAASAACGPRYPASPGQTHPTAFPAPG